MTTLFLSSLGMPTVMKRAGLAAAVVGVVFLGCSAPTNEATETATANYDADGGDGSSPQGDDGGTTTDPDGSSADDASADAAPVIPLLPAEWPNNGSTDCVNHTNSEPAIYKFKYDENTWILRENKCLNFEANFIYVLFGHDKVFMQDTGSIPQGFTTAKFSQVFKIRDTVEGLITDWLAAHPNDDGTPRTRDSMELLVTHTHSHGDHVSGDYQFKQADGTPYPGTKIAGRSPQQVAQFFGHQAWPNNAATVDLGGRVVEVLPIPGHEAAHVAVYDHGSKILLTGDTLYPGHIFVADWTAFRASTKRLNDWLHEKNADGSYVRPINHVLGTHIEKPPTASVFYPYPSWIQDPERKLELTLADVELLATKMQQLGPTPPSNEVKLADFAIAP